MRVRCQPAYEGDPGPRSAEGVWPCGKVYDDAECSTICPHDPLPPKRSLADLKALAAAEGISLDGGT